MEHRVHLLLIDTLHQRRESKHREYGRKGEFVRPCKFADRRGEARTFCIRSVLCTLQRPLRQSIGRPAGDMTYPYFCVLCV